MQCVCNLKLHVNALYVNCIPLARVANSINVAETHCMFDKLAIYLAPHSLIIRRRYRCDLRWVTIPRVSTFTIDTNEHYLPQLACRRLTFLIRAIASTWQHVFCSVELFLSRDKTSAARRQRHWVITRDIT